MRDAWLTNPKGHVWKLAKDGFIDFFAAGKFEQHGGPQCVRCGYSFCMRCESDIQPCPFAKEAA